VKRWSTGRKKEVVLRLFRGEPVDAISREVAVPIYKLELWRDRALAGIDAGLKRARTIQLIGNLMMPIGASVNWSWRLRFCRRRGGLNALWSVGGHCDELRDLRYDGQALWIATSLPGTDFPPIDYLRSTGTGIDQGSACAAATPGAKAKDGGC
jgi:hypothetical protein